MANEKNLQEMIKTSLQSIRTLVDANTVVGTPDIIGKIKALFKKKKATDADIAKEEAKAAEALENVAEAAAEAADEIANA